jgi:hypothetical protein
MSDEPAKPEPGKERRPRRAVKACGIVLITVAILPVLFVLGVAGFLWYHWTSSRSVAEEHRARVRVGGTLGEAILASEPPMGKLGCFQALCGAPAEAMLAHP